MKREPVWKVWYTKLSAEYPNLTEESWEDWEGSCLIPHTWESALEYAKSQLPEAEIQTNMNKKETEWKEKDSANKKEKGGKRTRNGGKADWEKIMSRLPYSFSYDEIEEFVFVDGKKTTELKHGEILTAIENICVADNIAYSDRKAEREIQQAAAKNSFNEIRELYNSLIWDGIDRISQLAEFFKSSKNTQKEIARCFEAFGAGCWARFLTGKHNIIPILLGLQRIGKSYFVRWLCSKVLRDSLHFESKIRPTSKDCMLRTADVFIWEVPEICASLRKNMDEFKAFTSTEAIKERSAFARIAQFRGCIANFIGTANPSGGLFEEEENKRFWLLTIDDIDKSYSKKIDVRQLWAQFKTAYLGGKHELTIEDQIMRDESNATQVVHNPTHDLLAAEIKFSSDCFTSNADIASKMNEKGIRIDMNLQKAIASYCESLGGIKTKKNHERGYLHIMLK